MQSMTGFGSGAAPLGGGRLVVEIRAVNHRFLDVRVRLPQDLADQSIVLETEVRRRLERGRIEVTARTEGNTFGAPVIDKEKARSLFEQLGQLRDELRPGEPIPLSLLACVPDLFLTEKPPAQDEIRSALTQATDAACDALITMREREGAALAQDLAERLQCVCDVLGRVKERCPRVVESYRERLRERIERLLRDASVTLDHGRLEHEVAMFADRSDVAEEITRLTSHCAQFAELVSVDGKSIGRRLDFLLQEMGRETNTVGAKSSDVEVTRFVVELKADLERMREQVQNVL